VTTAPDFVDVGFYHCTRQPASAVAVKLAARAYASGQRLLIVGSADGLATLDGALWAADGFLAHGMAGGADDAEQPILLAGATEPANGAALLLLLETGLPAEFATFSRVLNLFDDGSEAHARARADWKAIGARDGLQRTYWQQVPGGRWEKQA